MMSDDGVISDHKRAAAPASITSIQNANWHGRIPIQLSIAATSLSSPTKPRPIHRVVSRMTYLHLGLFDDIMHFYEYAPSSMLPQKTVVREEPPDSPPRQERQDDTNNEDAKRGENKQETTDLQQQEETITFQDNQAESSSQNDNTYINERIEQTSSTKDKTTLTFPECWFEDEESGQPLRWQLFVGVLYDLMKGRLIVNNTGSTCNKFRNLPWKIRIHFTSYPTDQLLPLDITVPQQLQNTSENDELSSSTTKTETANQQAQIQTLIGRMYRNSLKQALFLQYGSSKVAMSITKNNHEKMWDAVLQSNYDTYHQVNSDLQVGVMSPPINNKLSLTDDLTSTEDDLKKDLPQLVPVRVLLNHDPAIQKPTLPQKRSIGEYLKQRPAEILQEDAIMHVSPYTTLGDVLMTCLPSLFKVDDDEQPIMLDSNTYYSIQGVVPSLSTTIVDLWRSLCHPDHFLYVIVVT